MNMLIFITSLAMLAMVNAAPASVQEDQQKNLQGLLDILADQKTNKESVAQAAELVKKQQDMDVDGSMQDLLKSLVKSQQVDDNSADAQFNWHSFARDVLKSAHTHWANEQQNGDGSQAEEQLLSKKILKSLLKKYGGLPFADIQQFDDGTHAEAQIWRKLLGHAISFWAKQQDYDGTSAEAQIWRKLLGHAISLWAKQQDDSDGTADAQIWGFLARHAIKYALHRWG